MNHCHDNKQFREKLAIQNVRDLFFLKHYLEYVEYTTILKEKRRVENETHQQLLISATFHPFHTSDVYLCISDRQMSV